MAKKCLESLNVELFADGADLASMVNLAKNPLIKGFTTNPTLMRAAGVEKYEVFAREVLAAIPDKPISFEVFADEHEEMDRQARIIASWGENVFVKIPITNTKNDSSGALVRRLAADGIKVNVTAILTGVQVKTIAEELCPGVPAIVSIFAGRIADTGNNPEATMVKSKILLCRHSEHRLLWASCREILNIFQADAALADIITVPYALLEKLPNVGKSLDAVSLATVQMFHRDAVAAGYTIG